MLTKGVGHVVYNTANTGVGALKVDFSIFPDITTRDWTPSYTVCVPSVIVPQITTEFVLKTSDKQLIKTMSYRNYLSTVH